MREYDLIADWYPSDRGRIVGVAESLALVAVLQPSSCILDLGCGNGVPITQELVRAGRRVFALDSSAGMLTHFRANLPGTAASRGDARLLPSPANVFDAVISWGMMFHLPMNDQAAVVENIARVLKPGGWFLFTGAEIESASEDGITGTMNGVTFPYYAVPNYRDLLYQHGLRLVEVHEDPGVSTAYFARKS